MGSSKPPAASIDLVGSFARRRDADLEIVLSEPELARGEDGLTLRLSKGRRHVATAARVIHLDGGKRQVVARAPRANFADGTWSLALETAGSGSAEKVDARLLVQGERPLVLLWGATGLESMLPVKHTRPTLSRRVVTVGSGALDRVLRVLPPERAAVVRKRARTIVRRVLP